ncbi:MAG: phosphoenolpyruvate--protein phosphotransferase [Candidatus Eisenbacteria bacterium]|nr:phosphoenolpyruvate--protein phosphotransferase [Candidatus Eisenbacteria bacterium]MCC7140680.1 phosphoenolpyruvate--protein phosphotransferase [Candidatus Eisenbacteria bacterium]
MKTPKETRAVPRDTRPKRRTGPGETVVRHGVPVSGGLAAGPAYLVLPQEIQVDERQISVGETALEVRRFRLAVRRARDEIHALRECLVGDTDETGLKVLDAHLRLLEDQELLKSVVESIRRDHVTGGASLRSVFQKMINAFESAGTEYFRARSADIRDVKRRILKHLDGNQREGSIIPEGAIVVAPELAPSESAVLDPERVRALITDHGGATSHAAILARSRGIPAVAGLGDLSHHITSGDWILVDGNHGVVVVRPGREELKQFAARERRLRRHSAEVRRRQSEPCVTRDGHPVKLLANIESADDLDKVIASGADGIGLYRTEFFYLASSHLPDEEGQMRAYRQVLKRMRPRPVTIRTLDVGGDKFASYVGTSRANNPFLGLRGVRFLLLHPDILRTQLRAILRASVHGTAQILFPMISSLEETREVRRLVEQVKEELRQEGHPFDERIPVGIMIEVPSAVTMADFLARESDFFSIGSNDLIQYTLAVDRGDEKVAHLYDPFHPAVLRALQKTVEAARRAGIRVTSCGEMSGDPYGAALLLGFGCSSLSMSPPCLAEVKDLVRRVSMTELRNLVEDALRRPTGAEVRQVLLEALRPYIGEEASLG